ncbi:MAG: 50S ribosomal protein L30 [Pelotomaculum sp. PtaU1.Bin035]|nr:MAG: 50S ribosomal protein L30 [Pelotomaculum sp. PtaU1.Bin035]
MISQEKGGNVVANLKITLVKSLISRPEDQRAIVRTLGLTKLNRSVIRKDTPQVRGMINKVSHLLRVEEAENVALVEEARAQ